MRASEHRAAVERLVEMFGAKVIVDMHEPYGDAVMVVDLNGEVSRSATRMRDSAIRMFGRDPDDMLMLNDEPHDWERMWRNLGVGFVLTLGAHACAAWRSDVPLTRAAGRMYGWRSRVFVYPMLHMNAVLRGTIAAQEWRQQLARFLTLSEDPVPLHQSREWCVECDQEMFTLDADAVPWCRDHYNRHVKRSLSPPRARADQLSFTTEGGDEDG